MGRNAPRCNFWPPSHQLVRHTHFYGNNYFNTSGGSDMIGGDVLLQNWVLIQSYLVVRGSVYGTRMENYPNIGWYVTLDHWGVGAGDVSGSDQRAFGGYNWMGTSGSDDEQVVLLIQKVFKADDLSPDPQPNMVGTFPKAQLGAGSRSLDIGCSASSVRPMKWWFSWWTR